MNNHKKKIKKSVLKYKSAEDQKNISIGILSGCIMFIILNILMTFINNFTIGNIVKIAKEWGTELFVWSFILVNIHFIAISFGIRVKRIDNVVIGLLTGEGISAVTFIIGAVITHYKDFFLINLGRSSINIIYLSLSITGFFYGLKQIHHISVMNKCISAFEDAMGSFKERGL